MHYKIPEKHEPSVGARCLVEIIKRISRTLINTHHAHVGATPKRAFHPCDGIVCIRVWARTSRIHIHQTKFKLSKGAGDFGASVNRNFFAGNGIDANLTAEKQEVTVTANREVEDTSVLQKKLALFWKEELVGS